MQKTENKVKLSDLFDTPSNWSEQDGEVQEVKLSPTTPEYHRVKTKLSAESLNHLKEITRVQNPYLYHRYKLRELEYKALGIPFTEDYYLVHATAKSNVPLILKNNLDWRLMKRAKFGQGVSFSSCAKYANKECSRANGIKRAMIIAKVLVGKQHLGHYSTKLPHKGFDTTNGRGAKVLVKYYDDEFYPAYVAYYDNLPCVKYYDDAFDPADVYDYANDFYDDSTDDDVYDYDSYDDSGDNDEFDYDYD